MTCIFPRKKDGFLCNRFKRILIAAVYVQVIYV